MSSDQSKERVVKSFLFGGEADAFAEDGKLINMLPEEFSYGGVYEGPEGARRYIQEIQAALRLETLKATEWLTNGDRVVVIGHERSRFAHNDVAYDMDWVHVNTVRDGKIVEMREYNDTATMLEAFRAPQNPARDA
jgi:uncharacterized protein